MPSNELSSAQLGFLPGRVHGEDKGQQHEVPQRDGARRAAKRVIGRDARHSHEGRRDPTDGSGGPRQAARCSRQPSGLWVAFLLGTRRGMGAERLLREGCRVAMQQVMLLLLSLLLLQMLLLLFYFLPDGR